MTENQSKMTQNDSKSVQNDSKSDQNQPKTPNPPPKTHLDVPFRQHRRHPLGGRFRVNPPQKHPFSAENSTAQRRKNLNQISTQHEITQSRLGNRPIFNKKKHKAVVKKRN
jgi:hypothetical protein